MMAKLGDALAGVVDLSPYATKATVTSEIETKIGTLDKADTEVDGQVVSAVSRRALVETDIPTLAISKVTGLQGALNAKVPTSRTVNTKPLTANVVLTGGDILVGGEGTYKDGSIQDAIDALDEKVTTEFDAAGSANKALIDAKAYADSLMKWADFA